MPPRIHQLHQDASHHRLQARSESDGGNTGIIVGAVCGCIAGLALVLFLGRLLFRVRLSRRREPLPPVQPLAHQRERALAALAERKARETAGWLETGMGGTASKRSNISGRLTDSYTSLSPLRDNEREAGSLSPALLPMDTSGALSHEGTDLGTVEEPHRTMDGLPPPNRPFVEHRWSDSGQSTSSSSSLPSLPPASTEGGSPAEPSAPPSAFSFNGNARGVSPSPSGSRHLRQRSASRASRPISMTSGASGGTSRRGTLRGPPHSPHNTMQIILPAPLAPELYQVASSTAGGGGIPKERRFSVGPTDSLGPPANLADAWVRNTSRSPSPRSRADKRSSSRKPSPQPITKRRSQSAGASDPSTAYLSGTFVPPIPTSEQFHDASSTFEAPLTGAEDRGRPQSTHALADDDNSSPPIPREPSPKQSKLRKTLSRSRSRSKTSS